MSTSDLGMDARGLLLKAASLAPSLHNTQPWRFRMGANSVMVYRDLARWLVAEDPRQQAMYVSLGAAILNLRVAAAELGRLAHVSLLPACGDGDLVAEVHLGAGLGVDPELAHLFTYLARRRTNRQPYAERSIPTRALDDLRHAARTDGARLHVVRDHDAVHRLLGIAADAAVSELPDRDRLRERHSWVGGERLTEGVPGSALGPVPVDRLSPIRNLAAGADDVTRPVTPFERHPVLAVLSVRSDDVLAWLQGGQALQRVLLTAARWGLSASFLNQALEHELLRWTVDCGEAGANPLMIMRIGYGRPVEPTPRRPLEAIDRRD
jgi:nitroreductase